MSPSLIRISLLALFSTTSTSVIPDRILTRSVFYRINVSDWLQCVLACDKYPKCCSYNYERSEDSDQSLCELNSCDGGETCLEEGALQYATGFVFHQLRKHIKVRPFKVSLTFFTVPFTSKKLPDIIPKQITTHQNTFQ